MEQLLPISAIIKKGWDLYLNNIQKFLVPIAIMIAPYVLYYLGIYFGGPSMLILMMLLSVAMVIVNLWVAIVLIEMINNISKNQPIDLNKIFESSFKKILSYLWVAILTGLIVCAGFILLIIPGIIFAVWYGFSMYTNVLDGKKGMEALNSSKELVKGRWGATFWRVVIPALVVYIIVMIVVVACTYMFTGGHFDSTSYMQNMLVNIISSAILLALSPLFASFGIILFNNLKETKSQAPAPTPTQNT